jgi:hypothetical protein
VAFDAVPIRLGREFWQVAKSAFVFENDNFNHGSDFAKASSYAKASADKTTDRWHGFSRIYEYTEQV